MMKKLCLSLLAWVLCLLALPALAEEQPLLTLWIEYDAEVELSREVAVPATITQQHLGDPSTYPAQLRLHMETGDDAERVLPQRSLRVDSADRSFVLYNDGNDALNTKVVSAACDALLARTPVPVARNWQEAAVVYVNGEYQGLYTLRWPVERLCEAALFADSMDGITVTRMGKPALLGDSAGLDEVLRLATELDLSVEANRQQLEAVLDVRGFLGTLAVNAYLGNPFMFNEMWFCQGEDGVWRCVPGEFTFALYSAQYDSMAKIMKESGNEPEQKLARALLSEAAYRELFLQYVGSLYQAWTTPVMQAAVDAGYALIRDELPRHVARWAEPFAQTVTDGRYPVANAEEALLYHQYRLYRLRDKTLVTRPWYVYDSVQRGLNVSDEDMARTFGGPKPELPQVPGDAWETYRDAHR